MKKQKYYVVWEGRRIGVYSNWDECKKQIDGFADAKYKSFESLIDAENAFREDAENYIGKSTKKILSNEEKIKIGYPSTEAICVDASWNTATGVVEYKGVHFPSNEVLFLMGPYSDGTNNIGEYLAIVHALSLCKKNNIDIPIYTDSKTAVTWLRNKEAKTTLQPTSQNTEIINLMKRADAWLQTNSYKNKVLKWDTQNWGEIPADFGRK